MINIPAKRETALIGMKFFILSIMFIFYQYPEHVRCKEQLQMLKDTAVDRSQDCDKWIFIRPLICMLQYDTDYHGKKHAVDFYQINHLIILYVVLANLCQMLYNIRQRFYRKEVK